MKIKSVTKYAKFSAKKGRDVAREIVGLPVSDAIDILTFTPKKSAFLINKTLKTAVADAENNFNLDAETLIVEEAAVTSGSSSKRFKPRARGSASAIRKRTSHIFVVVGQKSEATGSQLKSTQTSTSSKIVDSDAKKIKFEDESNIQSQDEKFGLLYTEKPEKFDDFSKIPSINDSVRDTLYEKGVYRYTQIASWNEAQVAAFEELLSTSGGITDHNWVKTAAESL